MLTGRKKGGRPPRGQEREKGGEEKGKGPISGSSPAIGTRRLRKRGGKLRGLGEERKGKGRGAHNFAVMLEEGKKREESPISFPSR